MKHHPDATGRRERAKQGNRNRILAAATDLLAERDISCVAMPLDPAAERSWLSG